jgi:carbamoyl-phosphate synthase large subunit
MLEILPARLKNRHWRQVVVTSHRRRRLLVTSVGSLIGQNILDGLAQVRDDYFVVGLNSQADAVSNFLCDRVYLSATLEEVDGFSNCFENVVAREAPDLIIPGRDDDMVFLACWAAETSDFFGKAMVGNVAIAEILRDKWLTRQFAKRHGLAFVETLRDLDGMEAVRTLAEQQGWPLVAKPRSGNGSRGVVLVGSDAELIVAFAWPGYCFQPWLGTRPDLVSIRGMMQGRGADRLVTA